MTDLRNGLGLWTKIKHLKMGISVCFLSNLRSSRKFLRLQQSPTNQSAEFSWLQAHWIQKLQISSNYLIQLQFVIFLQNMRENRLKMGTYAFPKQKKIHALM